MLGELRQLALARGALHVEPVGSVAAGDADDWSDLDAVVVVADGAAAEFWPNQEWLAPLGEIASSWQWAHPPGGTTQLLLDDGRRVDVIVTEEAAATARFALLADTSPVVTPKTIDDIANRLLHEASVVVVRCARGERLVATHLAFGLLERCLEAAMVVRDLANGTCVHRNPRAEDDLADLLPGVPAAPKPDDVLRLVTAALDCFERLLDHATFRPAFPRKVVDRLIARAAM